MTPHDALAVARPAAAPAIPVTQPWIGEAEVDAVRRCLTSGWVTQGPEVAAFEREFAAAVGAPHACATSSGTTALHLALLAVGVRPGDEVVTVSHSFIATANCVRYASALPVFVDIDPVTFNIDPARIAAALSARTRAILVVHQVGLPCDLAPILALARERHLAVIEDAACATGSEIRVDGAWQRVGRPHADVACFSFHPRKLVTTGDGGMIVTARADWDEACRRWRHNGMSTSDAVRHSSRDVIFERYPVLGFNYRMTDIQAAVGREQLRRLPALLTRRRELAMRYHELLADIPGIVTPVEPPGVRSNWQSYVVRLPAWASQRAVMQAMLDDGVATRRGIMCAHREGAYTSQPWRCASGAAVLHKTGRCRQLRRSEEAQDECLILPLFHQMTEAQQDTVVTSLRAACAPGRTDP
jgi:dTDP-4-amino-4,6-dideoxygalactose transaminase